MRIRPRRLRSSEGIRDLVRETRLSPSELIHPLFVVPGSDVRREVPSMPGVYQLSVDELIREAEVVLEHGLGGVILFGIPESKDATGSGAYADDGIVQRALRALKKEFPSLVCITDVCLCEYTDHGHCGLIENGTILNDPSVELYAKAAVSHAAAGADIVAPSDMMDGRIGVIRDGLDESGFASVPILSYAVKYASAFYGPFRDAAESSPSFGDRRTHQMDPANAREAVKEASLDVAEGADMLMVKPAMPNLDIIRSIYDSTDVPIAAYQVSGEYSMMHAAAANGWLDLERGMYESLISIRRAGASIIVSYFAIEMSRALARGAF